MELRIYTSEVDFVIAASEDEANAALCKMYGVDLGELLDTDLEVTGTWPDDKPLTVTDDDGRKVTKTGAGWIASEGRGVLCSTEF